MISQLSQWSVQVTLDGLIRATRRMTDDHVIGHLTKHVDQLLVLIVVARISCGGAAVCLMIGAVCLG